MTDTPRKPARNRGLFLNFEGMDGCGKTTQLRLLADRIAALGYETVRCAEPGGTPIGVQIRRILLDKANQDLRPTAELLLYFANRAQNVEEWLLPALERGAVVLTDRFTDSTVAYQGFGRGLGEEVVRTLEQIACHGLAPDLTIFVDIDFQTSLARAHSRNQDKREAGGVSETRMDEQAEEFHRRVYEAYQRMMKGEPHRFAVIDGRHGIETVAESIWEVVRLRLPEMK